MDQVARSLPKAAETERSASTIEREIVRTVVNAHKRCVGRGPGSARAVISDEMAVVLLSDVLTSAERTLLSAGRDDQVSSSRGGVSQVIEAEAAPLVATGTGRKVAASMAAHSLRADLATFIFVFGPDDASRRQGCNPTPSDRHPSGE